MQFVKKWALFATPRNRALLQLKSCSKVPYRMLELPVTTMVLVIMLEPRFSIMELAVLWRQEKSQFVMPTKNHIIKLYAIAIVRFKISLYY